jgi:hypothetical protein
VGHPSYQSHNYQILAHVIHGPTFASEMPCCGFRLADQIVHLNSDLLSTGRRIEGHWACRLSARMRHTERCYSLVRLPIA